MRSLLVSIPASTLDWIDDRIGLGDFETRSDYLNALIDRDRSDEGEPETLVAALADGEASGLSDRGVREMVADLRKERSASIE